MNTPNENETKPSTGFAGLNSLVTNVNPDIEAIKRLPKDNLNQNSNTSSPSYQATAGNVNQPILTESKFITLKRVAGFSLFIIAIISLISFSNKNKSTSDTSNYSVPSYSSETTTPTTSDDSYTASQPPPIETVIYEELPPMGSTYVLNKSQIRYCLSEKIRMATINESLNLSSEAEVDHFNEKVSDYNGRCSSFRYEVSALTLIENEVALNRNQLQEDAKALLSEWRKQNKTYSANLTPPPPIKAEYSLPPTSVSLNIKPAPYEQVIEKPKYEMPSYPISIPTAYEKDTQNDTASSPTTDPSPYESSGE